jgi:predicted nuclease with RNAse H fold
MQLQQRRRTLHAGLARGRGGALPAARGGVVGLPRRPLAICRRLRQEGVVQQGWPVEAQRGLLLQQALCVCVGGGGGGRARGAGARRV